MIKITNVEIDYQGSIVMAKQIEEYNDLGTLTNKYTKYNNKLNGEYCINRRDGSKLCKTTYNDGKVSGLYEEWYDNGQLYISAFFHPDDTIIGFVYNYDGKVIGGFKPELTAVYNLHF